MMTILAKFLLIFYSLFYPKCWVDVGDYDAILGGRTDVEASSFPIGLRGVRNYLLDDETSRRLTKRLLRVSAIWCFKTEPPPPSEWVK
ncbi:MAG: hypothetical protein ACYDH4_10750 [Candidatus Cryosericum sp.]